MFEDSLITSGVPFGKGSNQGRTRLIALTSVAFQAAVLAAFLTYPLLYPESLPIVSLAPKATSITLKHPEVKPPKPQVLRVATTSSAIAAPSTPQVLQPRAGGIIHNPAPSLSDDAPTLAATINMGGGGPLSGVTLGSPTGSTSGPTVVAATPARKPEIARISGGVIAGLLLAPIRPVYPAIARAARVQGTVVVTATIDTRGHVVGLQIVSGPEMLRTSAIEAIREARYRPYLLSGQPTEVITTISVNFTMG